MGEWRIPLMRVLLGLLAAATCFAPSAAQSQSRGMGAGLSPSSGDVTAQMVRQTITDHVETRSGESKGFFVAEDPILKRTYRLRLEEIVEPVHKFHRGGQVVYTACAIFRSEDGRDALDIDFWVVQNDDRLEVSTTKFHLINREPRFTYEGVHLTPTP